MGSSSPYWYRDQPPLLVAYALHPKSTAEQRPTTLSYVLKITRGDHGTVHTARNDALARSSSSNTRMWAVTLQPTLLAMTRLQETITFISFCPISARASTWQLLLSLFWPFIHLRRVVLFFVPHIQLSSATETAQGCAECKRDGGRMREDGGSS